MGKQTIYTLKPQDCYQFALQLEAGVIEKQAVKVSMQIHSRTVAFTYQPPSPSSAKSKRKFRKSNSERTGSDVISLSNSVTFDNGFSNRPLSTDGSYLAPYENNLSSNYPICNSTLDLYSSSSIYGSPELSDMITNVPQPETIQLHEIAYCVTVPNKPRLFLLTSRGKEGLTCRIFLFPTREKAQNLKRRLAEQFEKAFTEWQARVARRRRSSAASRQMSQGNLSISSVKSLTNSGPNESAVPSNHRLSSLPEKLPSLDSDDEPSDEEDREMHREFKRRMSCMQNPECLLADRNQLKQLNEQFAKTVVRGSTCSDEFTSTDDDEVAF